MEIEGMSDDTRRFWLTCFSLVGRSDAKEAVDLAEQALALLNERRSTGETPTRPTQGTDADTLCVRVFRTVDGDVEKAVLLHAGRSSVLLKDAAELVVALAQRQAFTTADFSKWGRSAESRVYAAIKLVKARLDDVGLADAVASKRGSGYYWGRVLEVRVEEAGTAT